MKTASETPKVRMLTDETGLALRPGEATIRPQAVRLRWSNKARLPQEGQDDQEDCAAVGVRCLQDQDAISTEAMQALRTGVCGRRRRHEHGADTDCGYSGDKKTKGAALVF